MTADFVIDSEPYEPPLSAAEPGYAQTPPPFGQAFRSMIGEGSATRMLEGAAERGMQPGATDLDKAFNPVEGMVGEGYRAAPPQEPDLLPPAEINKRYAPEGESITDKPMTAELGAVIGRQKTEAVRRESILARSAAVNSWPVNFGTGMAAFMLDPLNAATALMPGVGEETAMAALGRVGMTGVAGRMAARAVAGATAGAAQQAPLTMLRGALSPEEATDYTFRDALRDVFYNAAFGAIVHAGVFGTGREVGLFRPDAIMGQPYHGPEEPPPVPSPAPGSDAARAAVPDTAFAPDRDAALRDLFFSPDHRGGAVDLRGAGFSDADVAALHRDGLAATDGTMTAGQWAAWLDEREMRAPAEEPAAPETAAAPERRQAEEPSPVPETPRAEEPAPATVPTSPVVHADAMRAAISEVLDGRPVDVQPVVETAPPTPGPIRTIEQIVSQDGVSAKKAAQVQAEEILARGRPITMDEMAARRAGVGTGPRVTPADVAARQQELARNGYATGVPDTELRAASESLYAPKPVEPEPAEKAPETAEKPAEKAEKTPTAPAVAAKAPKEPQRLIDYIRRLGGIKDLGGDVRHTIGGAKWRPGLVNNATGLPPDEIALQAWENGYFPEHGENRPTVNDLLEKIDADARGTPQYSHHDIDAAEAFQAARAADTEIDRIGSQTGVDPAGKTHAEFFDAVAEQMSFDRAYAEMASQAEAHDAAFAEAERLAKEWAAEHPGEHVDLAEIYGEPRTLEDLEDEHRQEEAAPAAGPGAGGGEQPGAAAEHPGPVPDSGEPRDSGVGIAGRDGEEGGAGAVAAPEPNRGAAGVGGASAAGEVPAADVGRQPDAHGNPIFKQGERVVIPDGQFAGRHGEVIEATGMRWQPIFGGTASEPSYHYQVRTDAGAITHATKLEPEAGEAPGIARDPVYQGHPIDPDTLRRSIEIDHKNERGAIAAEARARTPTGKRAQRDAAATARREAAAKQAALDAWTAENPDAAAQVLPEPDVPQTAASAPTSSGMALVETTHTRDKYPLFVVTAGQRVGADVFNEMRGAAKEGGGWWSSFKGHGAVPGWQFKTREAAEGFLRWYGGGAEPTPREVTEQAGESAPAVAPTPPEPETQSPAGRAIADAVAPAEGKGPLPVTSVPLDLLGRPIQPPAAPRASEPTIRTDERQAEIPGTAPSAVQAQAARDQTGRGGLLPTAEQQRADEGLFARPETPQAELPTERPATWGANNKLVTRADADAIRARLRAKAGELRQGIDPEMMLDGARLAVFHIEAGARAFGDYSREMVADLGDEFRPYLRSWYESARHWPGIDRTGMTAAHEIEAAAEREPVAEPTGALTPEEGDRLLDAIDAPAVTAILQDHTAGRLPDEIAKDPAVHYTAPEVEAIVDAAERRSWFDPDAAPISEPEEIESGIQGAVPVRDEGAGAEGVHGAPPGGEAGSAPAGEIRGSASVAGGVAGAGAEGQPRPAEHGGTPRSGGARARDADRVSGAEAGAEPGAAGRSAARPDAGVEGVNFTIEPGDLAEGRGPKTKARDNIAAIELAKRLIAEDRPAIKAEQAILVKYVGWGGLKGAFADSAGEFRKGFEDIGARLRGLLSEEEYRTAERSTQYAHYTAEHVIRSMWQVVRRMGFEGGSVFEPGMGIGHFLGLMPPDVAGRSAYQGIEMDHLTSAIAKLIYPKSGIRQADFTRTALPENAFDLVIGNPPFSDVVIRSDPKYAARGFMLHDYFFAKSLDSVRPGGLLAFITSAGTMNKMDAGAREYLAERAEFQGGIRMPSSTFRRNAGTDVTTDILFFKRRAEGRVDLPEGEKPEWTQTVKRTLPDKDGVPTEGNVSRYFSDHPENVLGEEGFFNKLQASADYAVHQIPGTDLEGDLHAAVDRLPENVMEVAPTLEQRAALDFSSGQRKDGSFYLTDDGRLMQYQDGAGREVQRRGAGGSGFTAAETDRIRDLVPMRDALRDVFSADLARSDERGIAARERLNAHYDAFVAKFGPINKAEFQYRRPTVVQQETARLEAREEARAAGDRFANGDFDPGPMLAAKAKVTEIARARQTARDAARAAGRPFDEGTFDPAEMPDVVFERHPNIRPFMSDPESYRLRSIEDYDDSTGDARKKEIFYRSILKREEEPEIRSANDGVLWSMNKFGRFDVGKIAEKMERTPADIIGELGDAVYKVPGTLDTYQTRDEYLSGDVVSKLQEARAAAERDPDVRRNIVALEAAMPPPLAPSQISMVLGMPWIPTGTVAEFVRDHLELGHARILHSDITGTWMVSDTDPGAPGMPRWGTASRGAGELLSDALNRTPPRIYVTNTDGSRTFLPEETQLAQDRVDAIKAAFNDWIAADEARGDGLAQLYNDKLNRTVLRQYDGSFLTTPGVASTWSWRPHQTRVVARIVQDGNTYMAHAVGAGKTSSMIGSAMEMKRLGLVRKSLMIVPNHMLGQFTKEFYEQYPTARIAVADEERFHTDRRRQFVANVAQDDLDAVIMTHSSFGKIPVSDEFQSHLIQEQIDMLDQAMGELDPQTDRIAVGRIQNQKEKLEQKLSQRGTAAQDKTLTFEELGTDFLFVDEAHQFRKLSFATKNGNLKGITPEGSGAAWDLYSKVRYLDSQRPGRSTVFASGTPVTNTMGELYSLSRFMQPEALKERGLAHFDSWAQTFGDTKTELEETAAGTYQPVTRFSQFVNLPELYKMVGGVMDIVTPQQLEQYVTRPKLKGGMRQFHLAPRTDLLDAYQADLAQRMDAIKRRTGPPQKGDDILLSVINDGRHAAIDPRFVEETHNDPRSKLNVMIQNVARIWRETANQPFFSPGDGYKTEIDRGPATQMIFANLGVNQRGPMGFSSYKWIKDALRREGVPPNEVAFIGDYEGTLARQALFNDVNEGNVRILVGSTQKMGTGVNAQRRLYALHNLDPLWFPADDEQRVGRALRQGNRNPEIEVHDYSTKGTYDSAMWKMMGRKARFIEQFFRGDPELRIMEDLGEAGMYEQASAMSTTDERIITLTEMKQDLQRAQRRQAAHDSEQYALRTQLKSKQWEVGAAEDRIKGMQENVARREDTRGDAFKMLVGGDAFDKRADAAKALDDIIAGRSKEMRKGGEPETIGRIGGFPLTMRLNGWSGDSIFELRAGDGRMLDVGGTNGAGLIRSAENVLRSFEDRIKNNENDRTTALRAAEAIRPLLGKEFTGGGDIQRLATAVRDLEATLKAEAKAKETGAVPQGQAPQQPVATGAQPPSRPGAAAAPAPDPEMAEAEQRLAQYQSVMTPQDHAEILAADQGVAEAEQRGAAIEEAAACLRGVI